MLIFDDLFIFSIQIWFLCFLFINRNKRKNAFQIKSFSFNYRKEAKWLQFSALLFCFHVQMLNEQVKSSYPNLIIKTIKLYFSSLAWIEIKIYNVLSP